MTTHRLGSTVERVTVFRSGAVVERRAALGPDLPRAAPDATRLVIGPLPLALEDASVRVTVHGAGPLVVGDVTVQVVVPPLGEPLATPDERVIRAARREVERLVAHVASIDKELSHLAGVRFALADPRPRRRPKPAALAAWRELDAWARQKRRALVAERVESERTIVTAREEVQALEQRAREALATRDASSPGSVRTHWR
ncbi:MAG: DUF4140 domain-containing protein [Deltaproteobacteria bacterium]|nr:DUF4140 domain-containing protein [Deltaproteobacteria bacterium]